jgi:predicted ester cyclase
MKRSWVTFCASTALFAALLNGGHIHSAAAADDHVTLANRLIDMWNQSPAPDSGVYFGGENDLLTWQDNHPADDLIAFGHILHVTGHADVIDSSGPRLLAATYRAAFPDLELTASAPTVKKGLVTVSWTFRGTFQSDFAGLKATGQMHEETGSFTFRIAGGRIVETWVQADTVSVLIEAGATPRAEANPDEQPEAAPSAPSFHNGGPPDPSQDDPYYTGA